MAYTVGDLIDGLQIITPTGEPAFSVDCYIATNTTITKGQPLRLNATTRGFEAASMVDGALMYGIAVEGVTNALTSTQVKSKVYPINDRDIYVLNWYRQSYANASISDAAGNSASAIMGTRPLLMRHVSASDPNDTSATFTLNYAWGLGTVNATNGLYATGIGRVVRLFDNNADVVYYPRVGVKFDFNASPAATNVVGLG